MKKILFFWGKIVIYFSVGLHEGRPSYMRSLQPSKENMQHFKTINFLTFLGGSFLSSWIGSGSSQSIKISAGADPDPQH